jgi:putative ABC transport system permease protein
MTRLTIKGLLAHKLRLALTSLAIMIGVTFITGAFVLSDTLHATFESLVGNADQSIDFQVRGDAQLSTSGANAVRNPIPGSLRSTIGHLPGVETAEGQVAGYAQFVSHRGTAIAGGIGGTVGVNFGADTEVAAIRLVGGRAPTNPDDVVMDAGTAAKYHFSVGQHVKVLSSLSPRTFIITGIADFGTSANFDGTTLAAFTLPTAQRLVGETGQLDDINVATAPGADRATVEHEIARVLPPGVELVTGRTVASENTTAIDQGLSFLSTALVIFALIALFVGGFTILNTFSIIVGQRTRELALLRIVGASRRQVLGSVLGEAAIVGAVSSLAGLGLGVGAAVGLETLLRTFGIGLPTGPLVLEARTVIVALVVGIGVTTIAAIGPARRAMRVAPIAAIVGLSSQTETSNRWRIAGGVAVTALGSVFLGVGLDASAVTAVGIGAACVFVGAAMLAPVVAGPLAGTIGRPLARLAGTAGALGRRNAMHSPLNTAQTSAALMVGVALVSAMAVFGASASRSITADVDRAIRANLIVTTSSGPLPPSVPSAAAAVPGVTATAAVYRSQFEVEHTLATLTAVPATQRSATVDLRMTAGSAGALADGELLVASTTARNDHLAVGEVLPVDFARTGPTRLRIGGLYQANTLIGNYFVDARTFLAHFPATLPGALLVRTDSTGADQRVSQALAGYPNLTIQSRAQFEKTETASVNELLGLVYALLALAGIIALIGIVNTLLLSVFERTHEIGLLRAVGMSRRQVRTMIRSEALIIAVFGAVTGIMIGTGLGIALVTSLRASGITYTVVPASSIVAFLVISAVLGLVAAAWPARRAARLDLLDAIAVDR